ncbi:cytochrome b5-like heme/steroid binding domain-containing protein [Rhodotorula diobovata]|uniref:Cytochrome b5-like heme/steroid binding domain-containing protein n=1 Tax=Rhodotorula diobovata TaxID=5288 RepID=A0A5C5FW49_9BASI|nr:cytochrome b5-like heme/steroid binding domain-containing protein [Rhodotorula diobovata]
MFSSITHALGLSGPSAASSSSSATPSIVAEPDTTSVAFPAANSQQRARQPAAATPSFAVSPPDAPIADDEDADNGDDDEPTLPDIQVSGAGALAPPTTTKKVVKAPKGRVRVEKGFSQLDWARLNRSGEVDLRVRFARSCTRRRVKQLSPGRSLPVSVLLTDDALTLCSHPQGGVTELRRITPAEMAQHNTRDDCWQAYGGKVYNVGPFLKFHPGGVGEMMRGAGKDATQLFMLAHAWVNYDTLLENCLVGFLVRD